MTIGLHYLPVPCPDNLQMGFNISISHIKTVPSHADEAKYLPSLVKVKSSTHESCSHILKRQRQEKLCNKTTLFLFFFFSFPIMSQGSKNRTNSLNLD